MGSWHWGPPSSFLPNTVYETGSTPLARGRLRNKLPALRQALAGHFRQHHAFLLAQILAHLDYLDEAVSN